MYIYSTFIGLLANYVRAYIYVIIASGATLYYGRMNFVVLLLLLC